MSLRSAVSRSIITFNVLDILYEKNTFALTSGFWFYDVDRVLVVFVVVREQSVLKAGCPLGFYMFF